MCAKDRSQDHPDIRAKDHHSEKREVKGSIDVRGQIKAELPTSFVNEYVSSNQKADRREDKRFTIEKLTLLSVLVVGVLSGIQTYQSVKSTDIARESLQSVQRGFIVFHTIQPSPTVVQNGDRRIPFEPQFENIGATPAIIISNYIAVRGSAVEPSENEFTGPGHFPKLANVVPPKEPFYGPSYSLPEADIFGDILSSGITTNDFKSARDQAAVPAKSHPSFWGWFAYRDIFNATPVRVTEFCATLQGVFVPNDRGTPSRYAFQQCKHYNCEDEWCPNYKRIVEIALKD